MASCDYICSFLAVLSFYYSNYCSFCTNCNIPCYCTTHTHTAQYNTHMAVHRLVILSLSPVIKCLYHVKLINETIQTVWTVLFLQHVYISNKLWGFKAPHFQWPKHKCQRVTTAVVLNYCLICCL
jgi:hypothetical protein